MISVRNWKRIKNRSPDSLLVLCQMLSVQGTPSKTAWFSVRCFNLKLKELIQNLICWAGSILNPVQRKAIVFQCQRGTESERKECAHCDGNRNIFQQFWCHEMRSQHSWIWQKELCVTWVSSWYDLSCNRQKIIFFLVTGSHGVKGGNDRKKPALRLRG